MNYQEACDDSQTKILCESLANIENENILLRNDICSLKQFISQQQLVMELFQQQLVDMNVKLDTVISNQELLFKKLNVKQCNGSKEQVEEVSNLSVQHLANNPGDMVWEINNFLQLKEDFSVNKITWLDSSVFDTNSRQYPMKLRLFLNNSFVSLVAQMTSGACLMWPVTITMTVSIINPRNNSIVISSTKAIEYISASFSSNAKFDFPYSVIAKKMPNSDVLIVKCLATDSQFPAT